MDRVAETTHNLLMSALLRALNTERYQDAVEIVRRYFEEKRLPQKRWYALEELLEGGG